MLRSKHPAVLMPVLALFLVIAAPRPSLAQAAEDRVVFATFRPGNWDVYHVPAPGAAPRRLTGHPGPDYDPVLSPDGRWVVFTSERAGSPDLFVLDLRQGGPPRLLVESGAMEDQAALSADGRTLVFVSTRDGAADLFCVPDRGWAAGAPDARQVGGRLSHLGPRQGSRHPVVPWSSVSSVRRYAF